jgi:hypothetical protein
MTLCGEAPKPTSILSFRDAAYSRMVSMEDSMPEVDRRSSPPRKRA